MTLATISCLVLNGLRTVDEGNAAFLGKSYSHCVVGDGLHDRGSHGDIERYGALFLTLPEFDQRVLSETFAGMQSRRYSPG